ncbi:protein BIG GRAIN 1-like A [Vitis riparia]|uniref:protein BIG GRAIN 1-like A n=1 Tax=Vitis riparia TaxID=96939 RepID=UPI00155B09DD|nr:protein BIG GRAIN 1-like A [Vitis riparia]
MQRWDKSLREDRYRNGRENPSFSSTLLDAIYRSIDEGGEGEEELVLYRETMRKKHSNCTVNKEEDEEMASLRRAIMIEKWMEKKVSEKVVVRRKSMADFERRSRNDRDSFFLNSTSSSSDSSSGGGFSSSEAESVRSSGFQRPKPIRTSTSVPPENHHHLMFDNYHDRNYIASQKPKHEGGFVKTKSRALKIYGDLKKVKQPISPGGRLASFLNSLFTTGTAKKAKISSSEDSTPERKSKSGHTSTCSSASSFSRSCLSKTPSSRGKLSNGTKRSVRFYPVSVIVDEDCRPCGHKCLYEDGKPIRTVTNFINEDIKLNIDHNRRVEEAARDLLKNYQKKNESYLREAANHEDSDDDAASCASSDLFELDNLSAIGIDRYREELPVYETTRMDTNRAIASGLIL